MRKSIIIAIQVLFFFAIGTTNATACNKSVDEAFDAKKSPVTFPSTGTLISECDLRSKFDQGEFPNFYWALHQSLSQPANSASIIDMALTLAKEAIDAGESDKAEKIYQIILGKFQYEPRVMSSYAATHILKEEYENALRLLTQAAETSPADPLILNNLYLTNILLGKYEKASEINKTLLKIEPDAQQHILRRAILGKLYGQGDDNTSWGEFIANQKNENNKAYWTDFEKILKQATQMQDVEDLIYLGDQWIGYGMPYEAVLLLDHAEKIKLDSRAYYVKAKAFEYNKHYRLAFSAAQKAREVELSNGGGNKELYGGILYEVARLAFAVNEFDQSLRFFDEYVGKGYSHQHLDYMYGVNLAALGKLEESKPYFQKCVSQQLPNNMLDFCKKKLSVDKILTLTAKAEEPSTKAIKIDKDAISPLAYLKNGKKTELVSWLGEVIDVEMIESKASLHVRWTAKFLRPIESVEIADGKDYQIQIAANQSEEPFSVDFYLNPPNEDAKAKIKASFSKEKYLIVRGNARDVRLFKDQLAVVIATELAIFTSRLHIVE